MLAFSVQPDQMTFEAETTFSERKWTIFLQDRQFCSRLRLKILHWQNNLIWWNRLLRWLLCILGKLWGNSVGQANRTEYGSIVVIFFTLNLGTCSKWKRWTNVHGFWQQSWLHNLLQHNLINGTILLNVIDCKHVVWQTIVYIVIMSVYLFT